jgi:hypothetical protein
MLDAATNMLLTALEINRTRDNAWQKPTEIQSAHSPMTTVTRHLKSVQLSRKQTSPTNKIAQSTALNMEKENALGSFLTGSIA